MRVLRVEEDMTVAGKERAQELPDDVGALKALVCAHAETISKQAEQIAVLEHNVEVFRRLAFGASSEKRRPSKTAQDHPDQGHLFYSELLEEAQRTAERCDTQGTIEQKAAPKPKKKGGRRKKFPDNAPVVRTTYELKEEDRICSCGNDLHEIGEDVRRELERIELTIVHEIACKKYACRTCTTGVRTAPGPERVIDKGILGKGFLTHVIIERFLNHMPYNRLEKKYASEGMDISRSVLQRSTARVAELLEPIWKQMLEDVLKSPVIFTDDTPVTVAKSKAGGPRKGRTWIYLDPKGTHVYDYTEDRSRDGPARVLKNYKGFIQADAYPGYDGFYVPDGATEVGCWAHVRRKFVNAESTDPELSKEAVDRIRELYVIERQGKNLEERERLELRHKYAKPMLDAFRAWMELTATKVLPKSPMYVAITYAQNQWDALTRYAEDGRLSIDNNPAERALRPFAVGRKNWLFYQNDTGGKTASILASLVRTAKEIGLDLRTYFRDVLLRISHCSDVRKLTPHGWKKHFAAEAKAHRDHALQTILGVAD